MQTFQEYITKELQDAGLSDEQVTSAFQKIYGHEKLGPRLNSLVKTATEEYNTQVGRTQSAQEQLKEYQNWYNGEGKWAGKGAKAEFDRIAAENARLAAENARLNAGGLPPELDPSKYLTKADLEASLKTMGDRYATTIKTASRIAGRHAANFHEEPDMDAIDKIAAEKGLPLEAAYEEYVKPRMIEREAEARKKWEKDKTEEIERNVRSQYKLPPGPAQIPEQSILHHRPDPDKLPKDIDADLMEHWDKAGATA